MATKSVIDFDHHSVEFNRETRDETLLQFRTNSPIAWTEAWGGYWFVTSYSLICQIVRNTEVFRSERLPNGGGGLTIPENPHKPSVLPGELDGEEHDVMRQALNPFFSKPRVDLLRGFTEKTMDEILAPLNNVDQFDVVSEVSQRLTVEVALRYVGITTQDPWAFYLDILDVREQPTSDEAEVVIARIKAFVEAKRGQHSDDVIGHLLDQDEPYSLDEFVGIVIGLVLGAVRTTADALTHAVYTLDQDRALRARLIADGSKIPAAVEEILRTNNPTTAIARTAMSDAEIGGQQIHKGDRLLLAYSSGNVDEDNFPNACAIDVDRKRSPHLTFGRGPHFCLGSWLARLELQVGIAKILEHMPNYAINVDQAEYPETIGLRNAWLVLPVMPKSSAGAGANTEAVAR